VRFALVENENRIKQAVNKGARAIAPIAVKISSPVAVTEWVRG